jgi:uncharacterized protein YkvS
MDGGKEFVEKIEELAYQATVLEIEGKKWSAGDFKPVHFEPHPDRKTVGTLTGLVDYLTSDVDELDPASLIVHVESVDKVSVFSRLEGMDRKRDEFIVAKVDEAFKSFRFENYMEVEGFVIALRSLFESTDDLDKLIAFVSKVSGGTSFGLEDDGVTQTVNVKAGVSGAVTKEASAPVIVKLRPFRTFRELEQVESEFLFRMKLINTERQTVGCALFEADGGRWRLAAVLRIKDFLTASLGQDYAVIA